MLSNESSKSAKAEIIINFSFSLAKSFLLFLVIAMAARYLAVEVFALILLLRRNTATLANLLQIGVSQTALRFIAFYSHDEGKRMIFMAFSLLILIAITLLTFLGALIWPIQFSEILGAGVESSNSLAFWLSVLVCGMIIHYVGYCSLLAKRFYIWANFFELMNSAGWFGLILSFSGITDNLEKLISILAVLTFLSAILQIITFLFLNGISPITEKKWYREPAKALATYGLPRGFSAFADMAFLTLLPWLLRSNPTEASYIILAFTILRVMQAAVMPITQVLATRFAQRLGKAEGKHIENKNIRPLVLIAMVSSLLIIGAYFMVGEWALNLWLADVNLVRGTMMYMLPVILSAPFFLFFYTLRSIIEVTWVMPKNLITLIGGLALQVAVYHISAAYGYSVRDAISFAIFVSFTFVGFISLWWVRKDLFNVVTEKERVNK